MAGPGTSAVLVSVRGVVQGVGFRPFVYRLAHEHGVKGWVLNGTDGVRIHAEGPVDVLDRFVGAIEREAPAAAAIASCRAEPAEPVGFDGFEIRHSVDAGTPTTRISPDLCICDDCARELRHRDDPRFGYPYINCTNCGPRYSIIRNLPYDRPATTMRDWSLCDRCAREYGDPLDRRFHAQPVACPECGPGYRLIDAGEVASGVCHGRVGRAGTSCTPARPGRPWHTGADASDAGGPISEATAMLADGRILAVKGIGGYHLACDARNEHAVAALRERKFRKEKPFAVMARTIEEARELVELTEVHDRLLTSVTRPIVLAPSRVKLPGVAPGNDALGVMLPYAPLHLLLFDAGAPSPLVLTSANRSSEPIAYEDDDAFERLAGIADAFLVGERPIARRVDDSVVAVRRGSPFMIRRSRGYAPTPVAAIESDRPVLAVGADLKNSIALAVGGEVFVSQYIGDLGNAATDRAFQETIDDLLRMYAVDRRELVVVHDAHPQYVSTRLALGLEAAEHTAVQHHRAHIASVLAEHALPDERVVGVALDGTGFGDDGTIWGGEFFVGSVRAGFERVGSLAPVMMPGGDAAARFPPQALAAYQHTDNDVRTFLAPPFSLPRRYADAAKLVRAGVRCFETTSTGRLFDAAAAVCGFDREITHEGQAAIWLEQAAKRGTESITATETTLDPASLIRGLVRRRLDGAPIEDLAAWFHMAFARSIGDKAGDFAAGYGCLTVVLSGGVWQNELLLAVVADRLEAAGSRVLTNRAVPVNDGGVALGQAALAGLGSP
ncbi:MAG: carbamoyltransferase HypF [Phycisphaeraceae bacterium]|nr:MAG: carbamoyltransferase HypF [Phycisphaeraceae bacterium]